MTQLREPQVLRLGLDLGSRGLKLLGAKDWVEGSASRLPSHSTTNDRLIHFACTAFGNIAVKLLGRVTTQKNGETKNHNSS